jgi:hypothetical protein
LPALRLPAGGSPPSPSAAAAIRATVDLRKLDAPLGSVVEFRGSKMSRVCGYLDHGETLQAAGLSE